MSVVRIAPSHRGSTARDEIQLGANNRNIVKREAVYGAEPNLGKMARPVNTFG